MANELDELMSIDPLEMTTEDLDAIIAYHRKRRAEVLSGTAKRGKAQRETGPKVKVDLAALGLVKPKADVPVIKRRL